MRIGEIAHEGERQVPGFVPSRGGAGARAAPSEPRKAPVKVPAGVLTTLALMTVPALAQMQLPPPNAPQARQGCSQWAPRWEMVARCEYDADWFGRQEQEADRMNQEMRRRRPPYNCFVEMGTALDYSGRTSPVVNCR